MNERPRLRNHQAAASAAARCSTPLIHRWIAPSHVPAFNAGVVWMMKKAAESSQTRAVKHARTRTKGTVDTGAAAASVGSWLACLRVTQIPATQKIAEVTPWM